VPAQGGSHTIDHTASRNLVPAIVTDAMGGFVTPIDCDKETATALAKLRQGSKG
jgi:hypothetical protein